MDTNDVLTHVAVIHNILVGINVHGDDTILMAKAIQECRSLVYQLKEVQVDTSESDQTET